MARIPHRFYLTEEQIPQQWYNLRADMTELPDPMLLPDTPKSAQLVLFLLLYLAFFKQPLQNNRLSI